MKQVALILIPFFLIVGFINALSPILLPFIMAIAVAYLTDPIAKKLVKWNINRTVAAVIPSLFFILIFMLITLFVIPSIVEDALAFSYKVPAHLKQLEVSLLPIIEQKFQPFIKINHKELLEYLYSYGDYAAMIVLTLFRKVASSTAVFFDVVTLLFITPVVMFYLIRDWPKVVKSFENILPKKYKKDTINILSEIDKALSTFLRGQLNVSLIIGLFYGFGLLATGLEMGFVIGLLTGLFSFIPYVGMVIGLITAFLVAVIQFQLTDIMPYIYIAGVFAIGQIIESMVLQPKLIGDKTGLHPVWVIFALMSGGQLGGFLGVLIALPVATIMVVLVPKGINYWQKSIAKS